jgi:hypothetical protein
VGSFAHKLAVLSADEAKAYGHAGWRCSHPNCQGAATQLSSYRYVTGKRGRVTVAKRAVCDDHAKRFADKHLSSQARDNGVTE